MGNKSSLDIGLVARSSISKAATDSPKDTKKPTSPRKSDQPHSEHPKPTSPKKHHDHSHPHHNTGVDQISNWKLFNDLENREEAEVLQLSSFLDALSLYMPGLEEKKPASIKNGLSSSPSSPKSPSSPPPTAHPSLGKTVSEQVVGHIDIADMYQHSSLLDEVLTAQNVIDLIDSCRKGLKIPRQVILRVLSEVAEVLKALPNVVEVTVAPASHITLVGDLHGQLDDLLLIFKENGYPSDTNPYLFNGDFVDRGDRGVEISIILFLWKLVYPNHVFINRGNHEDASITQIFGFMKECVGKYDHVIFDLFCDTFKWLPLATLIDKRVLVLHGGIPREQLLLKDLQSLHRHDYDLSRYRDKPRLKKDREPHRKMTIMRDIMWSDPKSSKGWLESKRGAGINYGPDVVYKFMNKNKLSLIVRSHECVPRGFDWPYEEKGMLVTLFSASNYCGKANNLGCFMKIPSDVSAKPAFFQYMARAEARDMGVSNLDSLFSLIVEFQDDLLKQFVKMDVLQAKNGVKKGKLTVVQWGNVLEDVLDLSLDWKSLQPLLSSLDEEGLVPYEEFLERYNTEGGVSSASDSISLDKEDGTTTAASAADSTESRLRRRSAFNSLYRHRARLEALFRVLDRDGNGTITLEELESGVKLLNDHLPEGTQHFTNVKELMRMLDFSHDNQININEFMEGFRINAKLTVAAKWKRAKKKIKALSALGMLKGAVGESKREEGGVVKVVAMPLVNEEEEEEEEEEGEEEGVKTSEIAVEVEDKEPVSISS